MDDESSSSRSVLDETSQRAMKTVVNDSIASLTDNLTDVIETRLDAFARKFSAESSSTLTNAVKKARLDRYTCKRKGNQQQLDAAPDVLEKFDEASDALKAGAHDQIKTFLEEGTKLVTKRIKAIKLADKREFGWLTVNEYLSDELASESDDEKRMYRSEKRAERKVKEKQKQKRSQPQQSTSTFSLGNERIGDRDRPYPRRLGPCFKLSIHAFYFPTSFVLSLRVWSFVHT